mmetsp:Transcript_25647/g.60701  ORF Transcript_25647/g.60701 Transcript_25647/m.60701 type:complete len:769 (-) Transcript_25647:416-2722(-)
MMLRRKQNQRPKNGGRLSSLSRNGATRGKQASGGNLIKMMTVAAVGVVVTVMYLHGNHNGGGDGGRHLNNNHINSVGLQDHNRHQHYREHSMSSKGSSSSSSSRLQSKTTIVTSIFSRQQLLTMSVDKLASIEDPLIVFVAPELVSQVTKARLRTDPQSERTTIISMTSQMTPISQIVVLDDDNNNDSIKPDTETIASLSRPWFFKEAARIDPFHSTHFIFVDFYVFFQNNSDDSMQQQTNKIISNPHPEWIIPDLEVLFSGCATLKESKLRTKNKIDPWKDTSSGIYVHHSNTVMAARKQTIPMYYDAYIKVLKQMMMPPSSSSTSSSSATTRTMKTLMMTFKHADGTINDAAVTRATCSEYAMSCVHIVQSDPLANTDKCQSFSSSWSQNILLDAFRSQDSSIIHAKLYSPTGGGLTELQQPPTTTTTNQASSTFQKVYGKHQQQQQAKAGKESSVVIGGKSADIPSAKAMLDLKPPFKDSDLIKLDPSGKLVQSPNTVVTGYFVIRSKYANSEYDTWMSNMLSLQDPMIIFTEPSFVEQIKGHRQHALDRTVIIPIELKDLPFGTLYSAEFWDDQMKRNPEKKRHKSVELFWIWLSKTWCISEAIRLNVYKSDFFVWSDIGCFRNKKYNGMTMIEHRETIPKDRIVQMAHKPPMVLDDPIFNDKYKQKDKHFHSGSQFAGYKDTMMKFHELFLETIDIFLERKMIIVDDQLVAQSCCLSHPGLCAYLPASQLGNKDNRYFGLRYMLHYGDENLKLWYPSNALRGK